MGVSTDGILFYGYLIEEDYEFPDDFEIDDWEEIYAEKKGIAAPLEEYSEGAQSLYQAYWKECNTAVDDEVVDIGVHCSGAYPMYYVAIKESIIVAGRGYPAAVSDLEVDGMWAHDLIIFSELMNLPFLPPQWYLVSYWSS